MSEAPRCYSDARPIARKQHRCCECRRHIQPGEKYRRFSGIWDDPATYKQCLDCAELFDQETSRSHFDEAPEFTGLWDYICETTEGDALWDAHAIKHGLETTAEREARHKREREARIAEYQAAKERGAK